MDAEADIERDDMLEDEQEQSVPPEQFVQFVTQSQNLAAELEDQKLTEIGQDVISDFDMDKDSMSEWFERMERGLKLAKLVKEDKNYPFDGAANVKYPLVTSAALQFNARSYPAIVPADRVVRARVWGNDPQGEKAARADRISEHMSWQLSSQIEEWEEETDKLLIQLPIVGTMVRKWWLDPVENRARCRLIDPGKFIVNDKVKNLADAPRLSEELPLYPQEIESRIRSGQFVEFDHDEDPEDKHACQEFIEQHTRLDLDEDGYTEPYIVTVHKDTQTVVRIVADFREDDVAYKRETQQVETQVIVSDPMTGDPVQMVQLQPQEVVTGIVSIKRGSYFVAHQFMPSMDGGFHGTGLGLLLGDISDSINTIINMMLDAGHYASLGGGFIGQEFRMKGGAMRLRPGEWKAVGSTGNDIRQAMQPMTFPGPDATLFQLLGMLVDSGKEIASTQSVMTGDDGGRNMQPTTLMALIDQGMKVFTAVYKRVFRALKQEYRLLAQINAESVTPEEYNAFHDQMQAPQQMSEGMAQMQPGQAMPQDPQQMQMMQQQAPLDPKADYGAVGMDIQPVADPNSVIKSAELAKAQVLMQMAENGLVDQGEAMSRIAEAMDIEDSEKLMPKPDPMQQQIAGLQLETSVADLMQKRADIELTISKIESERAGAVKDMAQAEAEEANVRLDALKTVLEDERAQLDTVLRSVERMAGKSGDGNSPRGNAAANRGAQGMAMRGLPFGQPGAGGGQAGGPFGGSLG